MAKQLTDEQIYEEAKQRVKAKRDFWNHLGAWITVNIILIVIWALTGADSNLWFLWPLCIWGVFVLLHALRVFIFERNFDTNAIEKEVEKIKMGKNGN